MPTFTYGGLDDNADEEDSHAPLADVAPHEEEQEHHGDAAERAEHIAALERKEEEVKLGRDQ